ncbi:multicopper oxidase family protein [Actinophytocola sp.]|uniref:multicopper oxidase family protein n=1 Tax=Actinophytocola sp. TaxID=1872138 RepID=UPI003C76E974
MPKLTRREVLLSAGAIAVTGATLLPLGGRSSSAVPMPDAGHPAAGAHLADTVGAGAEPVAVATDPFTERMPVPATLQPSSTAGGVDVYELPIGHTDVDIIPGLRTPAMTYGGQFVGPTIRARTGRPAKVTFANQLTQPANVHLHGGHVPQASDGHPMDLIAPGGSREYQYPNSQRGATLWYHDHTHGLEADHVYRGLHGFYLIEDPAERRLDLPSGECDVPIMLRNAQFDETGAFVFGATETRTTILVNGKSQPYFPVAPRKYRFRLLNSALKHVFALHMGGATMTKIASDGGLLPAPIEVDELAISSGERVEIVVDFAAHRGGGPLYLYDGDTPILRFDVAPNRVRDRARVPDRLRTLPELGTATVERTVTMGFVDMSVRPPVGHVNGLPFDPNRVDVQVRQGATEIWNVVNADMDPAFLFDHPFHMHLVQFQVIGRDGGAPGPDDVGLKDTVYVAPKGSVRVQVTFDTPYTGKYVYHCHYLEHSALGMMATMEVVP